MDKTPPHSLSQGRPFCLLRPSRRRLPHPLKTQNPRSHLTPPRPRHAPGRRRPPSRVLRHLAIFVTHRDYFDATQAIPTPRTRPAIPRFLRRAHLRLPIPSGTRRHPARRATWRFATHVSFLGRVTMTAPARTSRPHLRACQRSFLSWIFHYTRIRQKRHPFRTMRWIGFFQKAAPRPNDFGYLPEKNSLRRINFILLLAPRFIAVQRHAAPAGPATAHRQARRATKFCLFGTNTLISDSSPNA